MQRSEKIRIGVDVGGTFTDFALEQGENIKTLKLPTTVEAPEISILAGTLGLLEENGLMPEKLDSFIHGTTLATNAIISRSGARTALLTTKGFRDILEQGDESRFDQYDINIEKPEPLVPRWWRYVVAERLSVDGEILVPLDEKYLSDFAQQVELEGIESVAICFLHAHKNGIHEKRAQDILEKLLPQISICISSEVSPEIGEYQRFSTTAANAYVQPIISGYLTRLKEGLEAEKINAPIYMFLSNGGLSDFETAVRFPIRLVESGPAGGAIFASNVSMDLNEDKILAFDMGGTTAKICLIDNGVPERSNFFEMAREQGHRQGSGLPVRIPSIELVEIGAGGGSIANVDDLKRLQVGPASAGSIPGPASYSRGGEKATVTDADLLLGRLSPADFEPSGIKISEDLAGDAIRKYIGDPLGLDVIPASAAISEVVEEQMASAAREHAREKGIDLRERSILAFGGAAPLHAVNVAHKLGVTKVINPEAAGVGSAVGFLKSEAVFDISRTFNMCLSDFEPSSMNRLFLEISGQVKSAIARVRPESEVLEERSLFMRYKGQGLNLAVQIDNHPLNESDGRNLLEKFTQAYISVYKRELAGLEVECVGLSLRASSIQSTKITNKKPSSKRPCISPVCRLYNLESDTSFEAEDLERSDLN